MICFCVQRYKKIPNHHTYYLTFSYLCSRKCNHQTNKYYMSLLDIIFLAIAQGEIVAIARMAFLFGFFQAAMPLLGWLGISHFQTMIEAYDHWIAFSLLLLIGGNMIREAFGPEEEQHFNPRKLRTQLILAIATSIDALAIGISFACTGYEHLSQLTLPLSIIGLVSFLFSILGNKLGTRFGKAIARRLKPELLGGVILILIGLKILVSHLFA